MALPAAGQEEEKKEEKTASAPAPAGESQGAASPVPVAPAPVSLTQTVSQAPESIQAAPAPAQAAPAPISNEAAAAAGAAKNASASSAAAGQAGQQQEQASAATVAKASDKATKPAGKTSAATPIVDPRQEQSEMITRFMDLFGKMSEGKDPVAAAEWNSFVQMTAPKHQIALEGMAMRLRQEGHEGPGAGNALMAMMARDLEMSEDQVLSQISARSAQRLHDMNKWGIEKAMEMVKEEKRQGREDFWDAVKAGQWDLAQSLGNNLFGVTIDVQALKAHDPATQTLVQNAVSTMNRLVEEGKADQAKAVAEHIARTNPEAFGFSTPEQALQVVAGMDFKYEAWANLQERNNLILETARNAALSENWSEFESAIDNWANNQLPGVVEGMGNQIIKAGNLEEINKYREAAGKTAITQDELGSLSATEIAKDRQAFNLRESTKGMNAVDQALSNLVDIMPELKKNPKAYEAARRWVAEQQLGISREPIPPWDDESQTVHFYADWPTVTWSSTTGLQESGGNQDFAIDENTGAGMRDVTTGLGQRNKHLDTLYNSYLSSTPPAERISARAWFYATKGGTQPVPQNMRPSTPGSETPAPTSTTGGAPSPTMSSEDEAEIKSAVKTAAKGNIGIGGLFGL